jgi:hypothetical protein
MKGNTVWLILVSAVIATDGINGEQVSGPEKKDPGCK